MTDRIGDEKVAYVSPGDTTWCVAIRDGTGLSEGIYTVNVRNYYDTLEEAHEKATALVDDGTVNRCELNPVAKRMLDAGSENYPKRVDDA